MNYQRLSDDIARHEGCHVVNGIHKPYQCPAGKMTIGYGHNYHDNGFPDEFVDGFLNGRDICDGITDAEAMFLLKLDVDAIIPEARQIFSNFDDLCDVRQEVLVNMLFNMGAPTLRKFEKMIAAVEAGDFYGAGIEMMDSAWFRQVGIRAVELIEMMKSGE